MEQKHNNVFSQSSMKSKKNCRQAKSTARLTHVRVCVCSSDKSSNTAPLTSNCVISKSLFALGQTACVFNTGEETDLQSMCAHGNWRRFRVKRNRPCSVGKIGGEIEVSGNKRGVRGVRGAKNFHYFSSARVANVKFVPVPGAHDILSAPTSCVSTFAIVNIPYSAFIRNRSKNCSRFYLCPRAWYDLQRRVAQEEIVFCAETSKLLLFCTRVRVFKENN